MAVVNDLDLDQTRIRLRDWLITKLPTAQRITVARVEMPEATGMSMTTVMFTASWLTQNTPYETELVARVAPRGPGLLRTTSLAREFAVMKALGDHTSVPVPKALWYEDDSAILGAPFIVMDRVAGNVPGDDPPYTVGGWVIELPASKRGRLYEGALEVLRRIHAVDWRGLGLREVLDQAQYGPIGIEQQLGYWTDSYHWAADGRCCPTIEAALGWARENRPCDEDVALCWGDARIGNIVYDPVDVSVRAVIDWEMATLASPELDLGWCAFIGRLYSEGIGVVPPDGLPTRDEVVARYQELTGHQVRNIDYYEAFAALRLAIVMLRVGQVMIRGGALPADSAMPINNPPSQLLAKMTGSPFPDGHTEWIVGSR